MHQQLTPSLARTENPLQMLKTLSMFSNVQPQIQPQLHTKSSLRMRVLGVLQCRQSVNRLSHLLLRQAQLIEALQIEPKLGSRPEKMGESKSGITSDSPPPIQDFRDTIRGHIELPGKFSCAHAEFLKLFRQMFSRVNRTDCHDGSPNGNQQSLRLMDQTFRWPLKADSPLVVDADAVLTLPVTLQSFESVAR
jgi:hypothetical protein